jgi:hypothetical protein
MMIDIRAGLTVPVIKQALPPPQAGLARPVPSVDASEPEIAAAPDTAPVEEKAPIRWWSKGSFSFKDILDMLNPLQHLPVISTLYRKLTGETIGGVARIIGGAIYGRAGGIPSMISSIANAIFGAITGKDLGERIYAAIFGEKKADAASAVAMNGDTKKSLLSALPKNSGLTYQPEPIGLAAAAATSAGKPDFVQLASAIDMYERLAPACAPAVSKPEPEEMDGSSSFVRRSRFED